MDARCFQWRFSNCSNISDTVISRRGKVALRIAHRHFSFLGNAGFVYVQGTVIETTEQLVSNPNPHRKVKAEGERMGSGNFFFHSFHILLSGLKQTFEVQESLVGDIDCMPLKKII